MIQKTLIYDAGHIMSKSDNHATYVAELDDWTLIALNKSFGSKLENFLILKKRSSFERKKFWTKAAK